MSGGSSETISELLDRAAQADEEGRPLRMSELLDVPPAMHPGDAHTIMPAFRAALDEWRQQQYLYDEEEKQEEDDHKNDDNRSKKLLSSSSPPPPSFLRLVLLHVEGNLSSVVCSILWRFVHDGATIGMAYVLRGLVLWMNSSSQGVWIGMMWCIGVVLIQFLLLLAFAYSVVTALEGLQRTQGVLTQAVYEQTLKLPSDVLETNRGTIISLHSTESATLKTNYQFATVITTIPALIALVITLAVIVGVEALVAVGIVVLFVIAQQLLSRALSSARSEYLTVSDARIKLIASTLANMRIVKLMQSEKLFFNAICDLRAAEVEKLSGVYIIRSGIIGISHLLSPVLQLAVFGTVAAAGGTFLPESVFPALLLLNMLRQFITNFAMSASKVADNMASMQRYGEFFLLKPRKCYVEQRKRDDDVVHEAEVAIEVTRPVTFGFRRVEKKENEKKQKQDDEKGASTKNSSRFDDGEKKKKKQQQNEVVPIISVPGGLSIPGGASLTCIVGPTGSGASTLLLGLLGEAELTTQRQTVNNNNNSNNNRSNSDESKPAVIHYFPSTPSGEQPAGIVAYCPQEAFIQNASIRNNIVFFGQQKQQQLQDNRAPSSSPVAELDVDCYAAAITLSCLAGDLAALPAGDSTECGARGVTLSGGQKSRIMIARALYVVSLEKKQRQRTISNVGSCSVESSSSSSVIVAMDSILSAVDSHIAASITENVICGPRACLAETTRIVVTNSSNVVRHADKVIALSAADGIAFVGSGRDFQAWALSNEYPFGVTTTSPLVPAASSLSSSRSPASSPSTPTPALVVAPAAAAHPGSSSSGGNNMYETPHITQEMIDAVAADIKQATAEKKFYFGTTSKENNINSNKTSSAGGGDDPDVRLNSGKDKLITKETINTGSQASWAAFFWHSAKGGTVLSVFVYVAFAAWRVASGMMEYTLSKSTERGSVFGYSAPPLPNATNSNSSSSSSDIVTNNSTSVPFSSIPLEPEYMKLFGITAAATVVSVLVRQMTYNVWLIKIAENLLLDPLRATFGDGTSEHNGATCAYFDTTSIGTVLNVFGSDVEKSDIVIGEELIFLYSLMFLILSQLALIIIGAPLMAIVIVIVLAVYWWTRKRFAIGIRNVRRLENVARAPVLSLLDLSASGTASTRLYCAVQKCREVHMVKLMQLLRCGVSFVACQGYAVYRVTVLATITVAAMCFLISGLHVAVRDNPGSSLGSVWPGPAIASLGLVMAATLASALNYFLTMSAQTVATFSSVERIKQQAPPQEGPKRLARKKGKEETSGTAVEVLTSDGGSNNGNIVASEQVLWPSKGEISFENVKARYRPGLPLVLRGFTVRIRGGTRVGLVGRSGDGKSTVLAALFRLIEMEEEEDGDDEKDQTSSSSSSGIKIDGVDIRDVELTRLRSSISIVPQDPQLLGDTLRTVLDVRGLHSDQTIWHCIGIVKLHRVLLKRREQLRKQKLLSSSTTMTMTDEPTEARDSGDEEMAAAAAAAITRWSDDADESLDDIGSDTIKSVLDSHVREGGTDFSPGQRQLLCLARVLVRSSHTDNAASLDDASDGAGWPPPPPPKILCLDECSASLDAKMDAALQKVLRGDKFYSFTQITIAHRLATIADCDTVVVVKDGLCAEAGSPAELLSRSESLFSGMVAALGPAEAAALRQVAAEAAAAKTTT